MASSSGQSKKSESGPAAVRRYLVAYNIVSVLGWSYVAFAVLVHLSDLTSRTHVASPAASQSATPSLKRILDLIPYFKASAPVGTQVQSQTPSFLLSIFDRARTTYAAVGWETAFVQSFAILEVIHSLMGWVRSPLPTTAMQVASRLTLVWGITDRFDSARNNALYASMVLAWSFTEIIRYSFYAANKLQHEPKWLLWLRYNTFFVLYPLGAGSEAALIYSTLPSQTAWNAWDYGRATMFGIWWPGLYVMYMYMIKQRRKVLGPSNRRDSKGTKHN